MVELTERRETDWSPHGELACNDWQRDAAYTNWRPRGAGDWLLIYTLEGAGQLGLGRETLQVGEGVAALWAPGEPQDYATDPAVGDWRFLWAHFIPRAGWAAWLRWPRAANGLRLLSVPEGEARIGFHSALDRMVRLKHREFSEATQMGLNALEEALLWAHATLEGQSWLRMDERVRRAMEYLAAHLQEPLVLDTLAAHCGLSVSRLAHLFKQETGSTPQRYLEDLRMRQARQFLRLTSLGIAEIAAEVGYADPFYFTNRFRRAEGQSPSAFRAG